MIKLLVGCIASGKSTYCRNAAKAGTIIINDDDIVNMLHGGQYGLYDKKLKIIRSLDNKSRLWGLKNNIYIYLKSINHGNTKKNRQVLSELI